MFRSPRLRRSRISRCLKPINPLVDRLEDRRLLATFTVTNTNDNGPNSLRQAILDSNASPAANTIEFGIPSSDPGYNPTTAGWTITLQSPLPTITNRVDIDGSSQANPSGTPAIVINGASIPGDGLVLGSSQNPPMSSAGSTISGLAIQGLGGVGIRVETSGNLVANDVIAHNGAQGIVIDAVSGNMAAGNIVQGNGGNGIEVNSADGDTIGGTTGAARNTIGLNGADGIQITGQSTQVLVQGNDVLQNNLNGVELIDSTMNTIGGMSAGMRNVISGNLYGSGIALNFTSNDNQVIGNFIGTNESGDGNFIGTNPSGEKVPLGNVTGVSIDGSSSNTIGGTNSGGSNVISGDGFAGVQIFNEANSNVVLGNLIGTDVSGRSAILNFYGISINSAYKNTIGGTAAGAHNVISGNSTGIQMVNLAGFNVIEGNLIGTDVSGESPLANNYGLFIESASENTIGGTMSGASKYHLGQPDRHPDHRPLRRKRRSGQPHRHRSLWRVASGQHGSWHIHGLRF